MALLRKSFDTIGFGGAFSLGLLDHKHVLLNFDLEDDFQRCWLRRSWSIQGFLMKVFKWTPEFRPDTETPIAPTWIAFEGLPIHLHDRHALFSIANLIGKPLKVDSSTLTLNRPSVARVCVELDVSVTLPKSVWITNGSKGGFAQPVTYENIPPYCTLCNRFGHESNACNTQSISSPQHPPSTTADKGTTLNSDQHPSSNPRQLWISKPNPKSTAPTIPNQTVPFESTSSLQQPLVPEAVIAPNPPSPPPLGVAIDVAASLPPGLIDDHALAQPPLLDPTPGHCSDGDDPDHDNWPIQAWKACSARLTRKLTHPSDGFVEVSKKKVRRPRKDYSGLTPSITTRLAAGKIPRASFSRRFS